jgi:hypothetical protein
MKDSKSLSYKIMEDCYKYDAKKCLELEDKVRIMALVFTIVMVSICIAFIYFFWR